VTIATTVYVQAGLPRQQRKVRELLPEGAKVVFLRPDQPVPAGADTVVIWARFGGHRMGRHARTRAGRVVLCFAGLMGLVRTVRAELGLPGNDRPRPRRARSRRNFSG
jgi:hypothetical protein